MNNAELCFHAAAQWLNEKGNFSSEKSTKNSARTCYTFFASRTSMSAHEEGILAEFCIIKAVELFLFHRWGVKPAASDEEKEGK